MNKQSKAPGGNHEIPPGSQVFVLKTGRWATVINRTATGGVNATHGLRAFFIPYGEYQLPVRTPEPAAEFHKIGRVYHV